VHFLRGYWELSELNQHQASLPRYLESPVWDLISLSACDTFPYTGIADRPWYQVLLAKAFGVSNIVRDRSPVKDRSSNQPVEEPLLTYSHNRQKQQGALREHLQSYFRRRVRVFAKRYLKLAMKIELPLWLQFQVRSLPSRTRLVIRQLWSQMQLLHDDLWTRWENALSDTLQLAFTLRYGTHTVETNGLEVDRLEEIRRREAEDRRFTVKVLLRRLQADNLMGSSPEQDAHLQSTLPTLARTPRTYGQLQQILRRYEGGIRLTVARCLRWLDTRVIKLTRIERKLTREQLIRKLGIHPLEAERLKLTRQDLREELRRLKTRLLLGGVNRPRARRRVTAVKRHQWSSLLEGPVHCFVPTLCGLCGIFQHNVSYDVYTYGNVGANVT